MRLKESFVKKHIHIWVKGKLSSPETSYYFNPNYTLERTCGECGLKQKVELTPGQKDSLPASVLHLGDWGWH